MSCSDGFESLPCVGDQFRVSSGSPALGFLGGFSEEVVDFAEEAGGDVEYQ